jgi:hypothetical protein
MRTASTSTHVDTPIDLIDDRSDPVTVTVTDPTHPLYRRSFVLVSVTGSVGTRGQFCIVRRNGLLLRMPASATSFVPATTRPPACKLSIDGIRGLVRLARASGHGERRALADCPDHEDFGNESKPGQSGFNGFPRGEP